MTQASTVMTTNRPTDVEHRQDAAEELPLVWSLVGCGALSLLKVLLSLVTVLVNSLTSDQRWVGGGRRTGLLCSGFDTSSGGVRACVCACVDLEPIVGLPKQLKLLSFRVEISRM